MKYSLPVLAGLCALLLLALLGASVSLAQAGSPLPGAKSYPGSLTSTSTYSTHPLADRSCCRSGFDPATPTDTPTEMPPDTSTPTPSETPYPTATSTPSTTCGPAWRTVPSPNLGPVANYLRGIYAASSDDIWAVGYYSDGAGTVKTLIMHWDGAMWRMATDPGDVALYAIGGLTGDNVWAVGKDILHWDGGQWGPVAWPTPGRMSTLNGVDVLKPDYAWAVGSYWSEASTATLVERWDGNEWSVVQSPSGHRPDAPDVTNESLSAVDAATTEDAWAVGSVRTSGQNFTIVEHWNGTQWSFVTAPNPGYTNWLDGVEVVSANDVWAVGHYAPRYGVNMTLIEHWDGTQWSVIPSPNVGTAGSTLYGVSALGTGDVWAVGYYVDSKTGLNEPLTEHWDGTQWSVVPGPSVPDHAAILYSVDALGAENVWAAGTFEKVTDIYSTLVASYSDPCAPPTATPTPTSTPVLTSHLTWQGPPAQPDPRQQLPVTLTLRSESAQVDYPSQDTDPAGYFTVSLGSLAPGTYSWRAKGPRYLANSGTLTVGRWPVVNAELGLMRAGDANNDNAVNSVDTNITLRSFARCLGDPDYDPRADFDNSNCITGVDFNLLKSNFGQGGAPPLQPINSRGR